MYLDVEIGSVPGEAVPPGVELGEGLQQGGQQRPEVLRHHQLTSGGLAADICTLLMLLVTTFRAGHCRLSRFHRMNPAR